MVEDTNKINILKIIDTKDETKIILNDKDITKGIIKYEIKRSSAEMKLVDVILKMKVYCDVNIKK